MVLKKSAAVGADGRSLPSAALILYGSCHEFFPNAGFILYQHDRVPIGNPAY